MGALVYNLRGIPISWPVGTVIGGALENPDDIPSKLPLLVGDLDLRLIIVPWAHPSHIPNGISTGTLLQSHGRFKQTDRQTNHATPSVAGRCI